MEEHPTSKRDKRRHNMAARLWLLNDSFDSERDAYYNKMLYNLQKSLYDLHSGADAELREHLVDLEEYRDNRLAELYLWEQYQLEQAQKQYDEEVEAAKASYEHMLQLVKDKLRSRLETQRKQLAEDRSLVDIATDHTFFLQAANPGGPPLSSSSAPIGTAVGPTLGGIGMPLTGAERRSMRRRGHEVAEDFSSLSGNESSTAPRRGRHGQSGADSDADSAAPGSDALDSVLKDLDRPHQRHITKSYQGVKTLKNDEGLADLAQINEYARQLRHHLGYSR